MGPDEESKGNTTAGRLANVITGGGWPTLRSSALINQEELYRYL
jgi:hypothetical protein